ncbi:MAG: class I SAM-dependent methyltransferase, partial [Armatimonadetes bacterium]|nr:class I SAM-dependent methyltransferase [Armatimonadota bacterium]
VPEGALVLDAGCGTGGTYSALRDRWQVVGCDLASLALQYCRQRGMDMGVVGDVTMLPFRERVFDAVISCDVLEHVPDDELAARGLFEATKPGGIILVTVPALPWLWSEHDEALDHRRRYTRQGLRALLERAGWRIELLNYTVSLLLPPIVAFRMLRRLRRQGPERRVDVFELPRPIDALLGCISWVDAWLAMRVPLPPGASLVAVGRRE